MAKRKVFFVDIDNCLYSRSGLYGSLAARKLISYSGTKIAKLMSDLIDKYFQTHLSLSFEDANELHIKYYRQYGLAIEGLVRHHAIDAMDFNAKVDDALPLEQILKPDPKLRRLLDDIDRDKVKLWLLTNAYVTHGKRVVKLLGVDDLFEGITYCDYSSGKIVAKPQKEFFDRAMNDAGVEDTNDCYFVDDSFANVKAAQALGWKCAHLVEEFEDLPEHFIAGSNPQDGVDGVACRIVELDQLREAFSELFKKAK